MSAQSLYVHVERKSAIGASYRIAVAEAATALRVAYWPTAALRPYSITSSARCGSSTDPPPVCWRRLNDQSFESRPPGTRRRNPASILVRQFTQHDLGERFRRPPVNLHRPRSIARYNSNHTVPDKIIAA